MTFLEALYGSQYYEISQRGGDGNKGRFNANLFLSAYIIVIMLVIVALLYTFSAAFAHSSNHTLSHMSGGMEGKALGKLLAIPTFAIIYYGVSKTVGSETKFPVYVHSFLQYSDDEKAKANKKLLTPFLILTGILFALSMISMHASSDI